MGNKTLLAFDGSDYSRIAEALLPKLPAVVRSEVIVAHSVFFVSPLVDGSGLEPSPIDYTSIITEQNELAKRYCDESAERLRNQGINASAEIMLGEAASTILQYAEKAGVDIIAIGSRGMGAFASLILGSVARKLVTHAKSSVLIARVQQGEDPGVTIERIEQKGKLDVVLGYDGSAGSINAVTWLQTQGAGAFNSIAVTVVEPLSPLPPGINPEGMPLHFGFDHDAADKLAHQACRDLYGIANEVVPIVRLGRASDRLNTIAKERNADLIVISAKGHGAIERFLIGSVSYEVATSAPCSVLIVR